VTLPLTGFVAGITAARRADELGALLVRRGASVRCGPAIRIVPLVRTVAETLLARAPRFSAGGRSIELRGRSAVADGEWREVAPAPMALLRALAASPGRVVSRRELVSALPGGGEEHAVETAIGRLRTSPGGGRVVQTVVKRGYRLAVDA
jgi:uroporphyrinogen-III synthase